MGGLASRPARHAHVDAAGARGARFGVAARRRASRARRERSRRRRVRRFACCSRAAARRAAPAPVNTSGTPAAPPIEEATATPAPASEAPAPAPTRTARTPSTTPSAAAGGEGSGAGHSPAAPATKLPAIKHVFVVMLSTEPYATAFGPASPAHYLSHTLETRGELLVRYDAVAHEQLANEIALLSGQGPTAATAADCPTYTDIAATGTARDGAGARRRLRVPAFDGHARRSARRQAPRCSGLRRRDRRTGRRGGSMRASRARRGGPERSTDGAGRLRDVPQPVLYFHSLLDSPSCVTSDVPIGRLRADLSAPARTPSLLYIAPDRCHDGNPTPCSAGAPAGMAPADAFLARIVPEILASAAYRDGGLLVITVDEAPSSGEFGDSSGCCGQPRYPNLPARRTGAACRRAAAARSARCCSRRCSSRRAPRARNRTTTSRCCARSRTCSGWRTSATRRCPPSSPSKRRCSPRAERAARRRFRRPRDRGM